ncbi:MAG: DUF4249 domain-containing protein [Cytophagales bacterium]|nr:DUF4249 domain-containing protein [Cytophagales bacterium]
MRKEILLKGLWPLFIFALWLSACVDPYEADFDIADSIIVVDGNLTDDTEGNYVSLRESKPSGSSTSNFSKIADAKVEVIVNKETSVVLSHDFDGIYKFPVGFKAEENKSYQLKFTLSNGKTYSSQEELLKKVSPINEVKQRYAADIDYFGQEVPGHRVYISANEPEGKGDAYYWSWRLYEKERYCISCNGSTYVIDESGAGKCVYNQLASNAGITYDYECDGDCWRILYSLELNAMNDAFVDGKSITDRLIAEIPYYTKNGAILEITQHSINNQAYRYIKLLRDQNQNSGSLADTPSAALNGNMSSDTDPTESIGGYFLVSGVSKVNYYLDRSDVPSNIAAIDFVGGRQRIIGPATLSPPLAPCEEGRFRTKSEPLNWR